MTEKEFIDSWSYSVESSEKDKRVTVLLTHCEKTARIFKALADLGAFDGEVGAIEMPKVILPNEGYPPSDENKIIT